MAATVARDPEKIPTENLRDDERTAPERCKFANAACKRSRRCASLEDLLPLSLCRPRRRPTVTGEVVLRATSSEAVRPKLCGSGDIAVAAGSDNNNIENAAAASSSLQQQQNILPPAPPLSRAENIARTLRLSHLIWNVVLPTAFPADFRRAQRTATAAPKEGPKFTAAAAGYQHRFTCFGEAFDCLSRWRIASLDDSPRRTTAPVYVSSFRYLDNWELLTSENAGEKNSLLLPASASKKLQGEAADAAIAREVTAYQSGPEPWGLDCESIYLADPMADPEAPSEWTRTVAHAAEVFFPLATLGAMALVRTVGRRPAVFSALELGCPRLASTLFAEEGHVPKFFTATAELDDSSPFEEVFALQNAEKAAIDAALRSVWRCAFAGKFSAADWLLSRIRHPALPQMTDLSAAVRRCFELACRRGNMPCAEWLERTFRFNELSLRKSPGSSWLDGEHAKLVGHVAAAGSPEFLKWITDTFAIDSKCMQPRSDNSALPRMTLPTQRIRSPDKANYGLIETNEDNALSRACVAGRFDNAEWLLSKFCGLTADLPRVEAGKDLVLHHTARVIRDAFVDCAARGLRKNMEWMIGRLGLRHANFSKVRLFFLQKLIFTSHKHATCALAATCAIGRIAMAQWICAKFSLDGTDVRARGYAGFLQACKHGHLDIAMWFADKFGFAARQEISMPKTKCVLAAIEIASESGEFSILEWLVTRFAYSKEPKPGAPANLEKIFPAFWLSPGVQRVADWIVDDFE